MFCDQNIKVSVLMITYNHELFIEEAINSVLGQKANFNIELVIGDDHSNDKTEHIVNNIKNANSSQITIKYYRQEENRGANMNFYDNLSKCSGEYIALCEGDDYWIDEFKLQKQVNLLENKLDCTICFHDSYELKNNVLTENSLKYKKSYFNIFDLAKGNFIHTPTILFRFNALRNDSSKAKNLYVGDYILLMHLASQGDIAYLDEKMSVYRIHENSSWSSKNDLFVYLKITEYLKYLIGLNFNFKVKKILKIRLVNIYFNLYKIEKKMIYILEAFKLNPLKVSYRFILKRF
jgi:glycosyltransferase involved in cell wall biosynthesis